MRILLFDPFSGAAGDMVVGSLLDCGADPGLVETAMRSVAAEPQIRTVDRAGIRAVHVDARPGPAKRTFDEVLAILQDAACPDPARHRARAVFERIRDAEETVHGEMTHFHEVGADDAIAEVVGACTAFHSLAVDGVAVLPVALGGGRVRSAHGMIPVPAPATLAVLAGAGIPVVAGTPEEGERCTPTGAALLAEFSSMAPVDVGPASVIAAGYGAGTRDVAGTPNVLRAILLETGQDIGHDCVDLLETNVDDVSGEVIAHALSVLMEEGALDASLTPILMKKGRSGHLVRVIARPPDASRLARCMARELGSLGIRSVPLVHRFVADREMVDVEVAVDGASCTLPVKVGSIGREVISVKAEHDAVSRCARDHRIPARTLARRAEEAARRILEEHP
ncbi:MAG: nickel pincer cofactor biosynthesis protein LarC [Methanomicrobiales archaeon]